MKNTTLKSQTSNRLVECKLLDRNCGVSCSLLCSQHMAYSLEGAQVISDSEERNEEMERWSSGVEADFWGPSDISPGSSLFPVSSSSCYSFHFCPHPRAKLQEHITFTLTLLGYVDLNQGKGDKGNQVEGIDKCSFGNSDNSNRLKQKGDLLSHITGKPSDNLRHSWIWGSSNDVRALFNCICWFCFPLCWLHSQWRPSQGWQNLHQHSSKLGS